MPGETCQPRQLGTATRLTGCFLVAALAAGCAINAGSGAGGPAQPGQTRVAGRSSCSYRMESFIRSGTNAGSTLFRGALLLSEDDVAHNVFGAVLPENSNGQVSGVLLVTGTIEGSKATIYFLDPTSQGQVIAMASVQTQIAYCRGSMEGKFLGPYPNNTGDWIAAADGIRNACMLQAVEGCFAERKEAGKLALARAIGGCIQTGLVTCTGAHK